MGAWCDRRSGCQRGSGVFSLDGKMLDRPHLGQAERIPASAGI
jgi:citrate lyase beta subunit